MDGLIEDLFLYSFNFKDYLFLILNCFFINGLSFLLLKVFKERLENYVYVRDVRRD